MDIIEGKNAWLYINNVTKHGINADIEFIIDQLLQKPGDRILDVGYGTGRLLLRLAELGQDLRLSGVEKSQTLYAWSRDELTAANIKVENRDFTAGANSERYEIIIMSFFLHHVGNLLSVLATACKQLATGGKIIIYDRTLIDSNDKEAFHHYWETFYADDHEWDEERPRIFSLAELKQTISTLGLMVTTYRPSPCDIKPGTNRFPKSFIVLKSMNADD